MPSDDPLLHLPMTGLTKLLSKVYSIKDMTRLCICLKPKQTNDRYQQKQSHGWMRIILLGMEYMLPFIFFFSFSF